jgi:RNA polymerase sigma factor (sigma-70 family)
LRTIKEQIPEAELVTLLIQRDKRGMEYLYDNYSSTLYGVVLRIIKAEDVAEEVLQDCFLKFWNKILDYDASKGRLFTWMINIARNLAIDKLRSKDFKSMARSEDITNTTPIKDASNSFDFDPNLIGVKEILEKLNPDQRLLLDLMYFKGYSQSEISEEFNIPLGTVKTRVRAAMIILRNFFEKN